MLDARLRPLIDPPLASMAGYCRGWGLGANHVTLIGFGIGMLAVPAIWQGYFHVALGCVVLNRLCDGLDGAIARQTRVTDLGGYLDIVLDFIFFSAVIFGFALNQPEHALYAAFLIFSFIGTGTSFLAFAIFAQKLNLATNHQGQKSLYYLSGIAEGFETLLVLVLMCLFPDYFWILALVFGVVCCLSTLGRIMTSVNLLADTDAE